MAERITFDRSLYLAEAVEAAAAAYADYAHIELTPTAEVVVAEISGVDERDPRAVANAFANHVLHETIARQRRSALHEGP